MAQTNKITPKTPENIEETQPLTAVNTENEESEIKLLEENIANETSDTDLNETKPITLDKLAHWKTTGDYEKLEFHIRNGSLEIMPKEELFRLVLVNQEHHILIESIRLFLQSIQPILEKRAALEPYIEPSVYNGDYV